MIKLGRIRFFQLTLAVAGAVFGSAPAFAGITYTVNPDNYLGRLKQLEPGVYVRLMPGEYLHGLPIRNLRGTAQAPITISGPDTGPPAVFVARAGHNTVSIVNSSHVIIRNLDVDGRNLPVDGVKCEGHADFAHHITLDGLRLRGHSNNQQIVGISTKCAAWGWVIRNNVILDAGTGIYLGNSDGRAPFIAGLIEHNLIVDTLGYNLVIKHQKSRPMLPGMPGDRSATIIRHNVFSKAQHASKEMARPNLLVGHWPDKGPGANDRYLVYGNFFYQNRHESLFQGEGNVALYNNIFVNYLGDAIRIQPHNGTAGDISVFYNTVIAKGSGIMLARRASHPVYSQFVSSNIIFAKSPVLGTPGEGNLTGKLNEAQNYLIRPLAPLGEMSLLPVRGWARTRVKDTVRFDTYPGSNRDFDGNLRSEVGTGAYALGSGRPGWLPTLKVKPINEFR